MGMAELRITDGTPEGTVDLLSIGANTGFFLVDWTPTTALGKGDGIWQESPFVDGRRLAVKQYTNVIDAFTVGINAGSVDQLIYYTQELRRLLRKASEYWTSNWTAEPVWLEARADCETEKRYTIIMDGRLGEDDNPYADPMIGSGGQYAIEDVTLILEHQYWTAQRPKEPDCVYIRNHNRYPYVMWISPAASNIDNRFYSTSAVFDNLPAGNFTVEIWAYGDFDFSAGPGKYLFNKTGWVCQQVGIANLYSFAVFNAVTNAVLWFDLGPNPHSWTHIALGYDFATKTPHAWVNGIEQFGAAIGAGAYSGDAASDFYVGSHNVAGSDFLINRTTTGSRFTWMRVSNNLRYVGNFVPPAYNKLPDYDANTVCTTNGCYTWAGGNITWVNSFARYYSGDIYNPTEGNQFSLLGVESYLENETTFVCKNDNVFSANCDREGAGIDYAFWGDTSLGTFGPNIVGNEPQNLFPPAPAVGDCFYIGSGYYQGATPIQSFVMEFLTALNYPLDNFGTIEYWSGAWSFSLNYYTSRDYNMSTFVYSSEVTVAPAWAPTTINGYYGFWLRITWTAVSGVQVSIVKAPALISNPAIEVTNTGNSIVKGDLEASVRYLIHKWTHLPGSFYPTRALLATFSNEKRDIGEGWFTPYINFCNRLGLATTKPRNQPGIETESPVLATITYASYAPGGWLNQTSINAGAYSIQGARIGLRTSRDFRGKFRVFSRMICITGGAVRGDVTALLVIGNPYSITVGSAQPIPVNYEMMEFGVIDLPGAADGMNIPISFSFTLTNVSAGVRVINCIDFILFPVDEWVGDFDVADNSLLTSTIDAIYIDPFTSPKHGRNTLIFDNGFSPPPPAIPLPLWVRYVSGKGAVVSMSNKTPILQANTPQKIYCLDGAYTAAKHQFATYFDRAWSIEKMEQYESMRGNR